MSKPMPRDVKTGRVNQNAPWPKWRIVKGIIGCASGGVPIFGWYVIGPTVEWYTGHFLDRNFPTYKQALVHFLDLERLGELV